MHTSHPAKYYKTVELFTLGYIFLFSLIAVSRGNYEFLFYTTYMVVMVWGIARYHATLHISELVVGLISLFGLLHLLGGTVYLGDIRLYDMAFFGGPLHFDNLVHTCGGMLAAAVSYNVLHIHFDKSVRHHHLVESFILVTLASGIGAYNELIELCAVVFLDAGVEIGDYMNNAVDLVFNFIGAALCTILIFYLYPHLRRNK